VNWIDSVGWAPVAAVVLGPGMPARDMCCISCSDCEVGIWPDGLISRSDGPRH